VNGYQAGRSPWDVRAATIVRNKLTHAAIIGLTSNPRIDWASEVRVTMAVRLSDLTYAAISAANEGMRGRTISRVALLAIDMLQAYCANPRIHWEGNQIDIQVATQVVDDAKRANTELKEHLP
jgi:hypothetical protein